MKPTYFETNEEVFEAFECGYLKPSDHVHANYGYGIINEAPAIFWETDSGRLAHQTNESECLLRKDKYLDELRQSISWSDIREEHIIPDILPCPCCGGTEVKFMSKRDMVELFVDEDAVIIGDYSDSTHYLICDGSNGGCGLSTGYADSKLNVMKLWNRRA